MIFKRTRRLRRPQAAAASGRQFFFVDIFVGHRDIFVGQRDIFVGHGDNLSDIGTFLSDIGTIVGHRDMYQFDQFLGSSSRIGLGRHPKMFQNLIYIKSKHHAKFHCHRISSF